MLVQDIMTKHPTCIQAHQTLREAMHLLSELDVRHLPVVDDGEVVGMISDRDLRPFSPHALVDADIPLLIKGIDRKVVEIMSGDVLSVAPDSSVQELVELLIENRIGAVPVLDPIGNSLVGIVSYVDVLKATLPLLD